MGKRNSSESQSNSLKSKDPNAEDSTEDVTTNEWPSWYIPNGNPKRKNSQKRNVSASSTA